jgi:hypothetical protein
MTDTCAALSSLRRMTLISGKPSRRTTPGLAATNPSIISCATCSASFSTFAAVVADMVAAVPARESLSWCSQVPLGHQQGVCAIQTRVSMGTEQADQDSWMSEFVLFTCDTCYVYMVRPSSILCVRSPWGRLRSGRHDGSHANGSDARTPHSAPDAYLLQTLSPLSSLPFSSTPFAGQLSDAEETPATSALTALGTVAICSPVLCAPHRSLGTSQNHRSSRSHLHWSSSHVKSGCGAAQVPPARSSAGHRAQDWNVEQWLQEVTLRLAEQVCGSNPAPAA